MSDPSPELTYEIMDKIKQELHDAGERIVASHVSGADNQTAAAIGAHIAAVMADIAEVSRRQEFAVNSVFSRFGIPVRAAMITDTFNLTPKEKLN